MDKIVNIKFREGFDTEFDSSLSQWDYGQTLQVEGLRLPDGNIEVDFSLTEIEGDASTFFGTVKDNIVTIDIPDFIFQKENTYNFPTYDAYVYIYQSDGESGRTIKKIVLTIEARAGRTTDVPDDKQDLFLEEVRGIMNETKEIAQSVRDDADAGAFNGEPGPPGPPGESSGDVLSPTATVEQTENGAVITIIDKNGETTATVYNGKDGNDGADGYTPQKGIDYFTEGDKQEITNQIFEQVTNGNEVAY